MGRSRASYQGRPEGRVVWIFSTKNSGYTQDCMEKHEVISDEQPLLNIFRRHHGHTYSPVIAICSQKLRISFHADRPIFPLVYAPS